MSTKETMKRRSKRAKKCLKATMAMLESLLKPTRRVKKIQAQCCAMKWSLCRCMIFFILLYFLFCLVGKGDGMNAWRGPQEIVLLFCCDLNAFDRFLHLSLINSKTKNWQKYVKLDWIFQSVFKKLFDFFSSPLNHHQTFFIFVVFPSHRIRRVGILKIFFLSSSHCFQIRWCWML